MKTGLDFDLNKYKNYSKEKLEKELHKVKRLGATNFDFFYNFLLNDKDNKDMILKTLKKLNFTITIHSNPIEGKWTTFLTKEDMEKSLKLHKKALKDARKNLDEYGFTDETVVVFHSGYYDSLEDKEKMFKLNIEFFKELSKEAKKNKIHVLVETLSMEHPHTKVIGNNWNDIERFCDEIKNENFGICWDMGHTHLNFMEHNQEMLPNVKITKKMKHTHIHNMHMGISLHDIRCTSEGCHNLYHRYNHEHNFEEGKDHMPLEDFKFQEEEVKWLCENKYDWSFSLEYAYNRINDLRIPYKKVYDSIKLLREKVNYYRKVKIFR